MKKENEVKSCGSKTLGILSIILGIFMPIVGIILGIIGLSISKPVNLKSDCITLNVLGLVLSFVFWIFWAMVLLSTPYWFI
jgi:hypothetical protein